MIASVAAILKFAELAAFRLFLAANLLFWVFDFMGTKELKRQYGSYSTNAAKSNLKILKSTSGLRHIFRHIVMTSIVLVMLSYLECY